MFTFHIFSLYISLIDSAFNKIDTILKKIGTLNILRIATEVVPDLVAGIEDIVHAIDHIHIHVIDHGHMTELVADIDPDPDHILVNESEGVDVLNHVLAKDQ